MACPKLLVGLFAIVFFVSACQNPQSQTNQFIANEAQEKIDRLLELIDQRLSIAPQVAKSKWNTGSPVNDAKREARMLNEIVAQTKVGHEKCDSALVKNFFQDQFNAGKIIQTHLLISWRKTYLPKYKFKDVPHLAREIRPQLDKLTPELISAFCDVQTVWKQPGSRQYLFVQADKEIRDDVNGAARRQALKVFGAD